jgi:CRP-like cAMP-binding protein
MDPDRLKAIPLFASLDDETLRAIATFATETSVPAGKHLLTEGDYAYELMAIEEGQAEVVRGASTSRPSGPASSSARWRCSRTRCARRPSSR